MKTIVLVACGKQKALGRRKAKDQYTSTLFRLSRRYAEARGDRWFILSAKHRLADPETEIGHYELSLNDMYVHERLRWAAAVRDQLKPHLDRDDTVVILGGKAYAEDLAPMLERHCGRIETPLDGMGIGKRLGWLKEETQRMQETGQGTGLGSADPAPHPPLPSE